MIRIKLMVLLIVSNCFVHAKTYTFVPKWEKGDQKTVSIEYHEQEYKNDSLVEDSTYYNEATIKVKSVSDTKYKLEIIMENQAMKQIIELYDKLGDDLLAYQNMKLVYSINRKTGDYKLLNWKEAKEFLFTSFAQMDSALARKAPEAEGMGSLMLAPILALLNTEENVSAYFAKNIDYLLVPFWKEFELGQTITEIDSADNPFSKGEKLSQTNYTTMDSLYNRKKSAIISHVVDVDFSSVISMLKKMTKEMMSGFGLAEEKIDEKLKEFDNMQMDQVNKTIYYYDVKTTWINKCVAEATVIATDPRNKAVTKKVVQSITTIK